jgi:hypothetical protein
MAGTNQHINARNDSDLIERFIAAAEQAGLDNASSWVGNNIGRLITVAIDGNQTVADVHAYADEVRKAYIDATPMRPGKNPGAVTDTHLDDAISAVVNALNPA